MNGYWQGLRPFEKRLVVGVGALFFVVLNALFVWPHFSDMAQVKFRMQVAQDKLAKYQLEIQQSPTYQTAVRKLEGEGLSVPPEDQALQFNNAINAQAGQSGVVIVQTQGKINTQTNVFFIEKSQNIVVQAAEKQLVDFLYNLGSGNSLIRVRDLGLRPEPGRHQLVATVKLVATYQKKGAARPGTSPTIAATGPSTTRSPSPVPPLAERANSKTK